MSPFTSTSTVGSWLMSKHNIVTAVVSVPGEFNGMRITPNVYTTVDEVDLFADRVISAIKTGVV